MMQDNDRDDVRDRQHHDSRDNRHTGSATDSGVGAGAPGGSVGGVTDGGAGGVGGTVADSRGNMGGMGGTTISGSPGMAGGVYTGGEVFGVGDVNDTIGTLHGADAGIGEAVGGRSGPVGGRSPGITDQDTITPVSTGDTETSRSDQAPGGAAATRPKAA